MPALSFLHLFVRNELSCKFVLSSEAKKIINGTYYTHIYAIIYCFATVLNFYQ